MATVKFLFGSKTALPTSAPTNALLFTDTGELFKGTGTGLLSFGSVLYGFADLDDLQSKVTTGITGKLYLTQDNKLYTFSNGVFSLVAGSSTMESFEALKVTYDNTTSTLVGENVQSAITELDGKVETNKADIVNANGKITTLETDNTQNKADIAELQASEGQVKSSTGDTLGFLDSKVDGVTIVVEGDKLVIKSIEGLTVGSTDINQLTGVTSNVQAQFDTLQNAISASASGMSYGGKVATKVDLDTAPKVNGSLVVVIADEDNDNASTMYIYSDTSTSYEFVGKFEFNESFIGLSDTPSAYVDGKILKSTASGIIFTDQDYNDLINKPTSSIIDIDDAVTKKHSHTFDEVALNKISEDTDGNLLFDGKQVKAELVWESFNI